MPNYETRTTTASLVAAVPQRILNGNQNRVAVILSCSDSGVAGFCGIATDIPGATFASFYPPFTQSLTYRDYGPLITGGMQMFSNAAPLTVQVTEITRVPEGA